jgi:KaiC/GvpD/RAD55 family RecA-like ATPase
MDKCPTGIPGLDDLLEGGFPRGRVILVAGDCGTGKSIMGMQFLHNGVVNFDEPGILVSLEQSPEMYREDMLSMGFDIGRLEREGKLIIIDASLSGLGVQKKKGDFTLTPEHFSIDAILALISEAAKKIGAKRAVVDSFSALDSILESRKSRVGIELREDIRRAILSINYKLEDMKLTSLLISDILENKLSTHGVEEFMVDGVITLHYTTAGADAGRHLVIKKMRTIKHSENIHQIVFEKGSGMKVLKA